MALFWIHVKRSDDDESNCNGESFYVLSPSGQNNSENYLQIVGTMFFLACRGLSIVQKMAVGSLTSDRTI